jgi:hypothetical protein
METTLRYTQMETTLRYTTLRYTRMETTLRYTILRSSTLNKKEGVPTVGSASLLDMDRVDLEEPSPFFFHLALPNTLNIYTISTQIVSLNDSIIK